MGQLFRGVKLAATELAAHVVTRLLLKEETLASLTPCLKLLSSVCPGASTTASFQNRSLGQELTVHCIGAHARSSHKRVQSGTCTPQSYGILPQDSVFP